MGKYAKYKEGGKLVGGQHKLDKDGDDFKMMKYGGRISRAALKRAMKKKRKK